MLMVNVCGRQVAILLTYCLKHAYFHLWASIPCTDWTKDGTYSGCLLPTMATCWGNWCCCSDIHNRVYGFFELYRSVSLVGETQSASCKVIHFVAQVDWWQLNSSENTTMMIRPACQDWYFISVLPVLFRRVQFWLLCVLLPVTVITLFCYTCVSLPYVFKPCLCSVCKLSCIPCLPCLSESHLNFTAPQIKESDLWTLYICLLLPVAFGF